MIRTVDGMEAAREVALMDCVTQLATLSPDWMRWALDSNPYGLADGLDNGVLPLASGGTGSDLSVGFTSPLSVWQCAYCGGLRPGAMMRCSGCGAARQ